MRFWSDPDTELKLAKDTGVQVFRMGIDWTRVMPEEPVNGTKSIVSVCFRICGLLTTRLMCAKYHSFYVVTIRQAQGHKRLNLTSDIFC